LTGHCSQRLCYAALTAALELEAVLDCVPLWVSVLDAVHEPVLDAVALAVRDCRRSGAAQGVSRRSGLPHVEEGIARVGVTPTVCQRKLSLERSQPSVSTATAQRFPM